MASRSQSSARPAPAPESKTKQDVNFGSKPGRAAGGSRGGGRGGAGGGRRREPNNAAAAANSRRPTPRGGRSGGGKQPLSRGYQSNHLRGTVAQEDEFQVGSVFNSGSKKQSLNHLLNFQYTPRGNGQETDRSRGPRPSKNHNQQHRQTFSKEQYLQSNCQFIVEAVGDYSVHLVDPDVPVNWDNIQEVYLKTSGSEPTSCPICLFPPIAGKISRCGHVFCWPCILHYLALSDDDWRKCPICYVNISKSDLKSVQAITQETLGTGSMVEMRLMKRERNSTLAVPVNHPGLDAFPFVNDQEENKALSKLIKATPEQVLSRILIREQEELQQRYREEKDQPESIFIKEALALLESRINMCLETRGMFAQMPPINPVVPQAVNVDTTTSGDINPDQLTVSQSVDPFEDLDDVLGALPSVTKADGAKVVVGELGARVEGDRPRHASSSSDASSEGEDISEETTVTADDLDIASLQPTNVDKQAPKSTFYFYQDTSGQRIFLHALNLTMLVREFGSIEACPTTIKARILEKDSSTMTDLLRDRLRYLRHLPVSSSFEVTELDLSSIVGKNTIAAFRDQLEDRKRKRDRKRKAEKVREKRIHRDEMRIMGRFPSPMARIESAYHYPVMGSSLDPSGEVASLASSLDSQNSFPEAVQLSQEAAHQAVRDVAASSSRAVSASSFNEAATLNFARIAKQAPAAQLSTISRPKTTNSNGMVQLGGFLPVARVRQGSESDPEPEGYIRAPPVASLGDVFAQALAQAPAAAQSNNPGGNKKKGKKSRGTPILLTGGGQRPLAKF